MCIIWKLPTLLLYCHFVSIILTLCKHRVGGGWYIIEWKEFEQKPRHATLLLPMPYPFGSFLFCLRGVYHHTSIIPWYHAFLTNTIYACNIFHSSWVKPFSCLPLLCCNQLQEIAPARQGNETKCTVDRPQQCIDTIASLGWLLTTIVKYRLNLVCFFNFWLCK